MRSISVIIPTLNERERVVSLVSDLRYLEPGLEILVVDGGSEDGTAAVASGRARVLTAPRGRAAQMNAGARQATGDVLWFLHCDCRPHAESLRCIRETLIDAAVVGGAFSFAFDPPEPFLRLVAAVANRKNRLFGLLYGDMGIFIRADVFRRLGGYRELPVMEDMDLCRRMKRQGKIAIVSRPIQTSARRWQSEGRMYNLLRNWGLQIAWTAGVPADRLGRCYQPWREPTDANTNRRERSPGKAGHGAA